MGVRIARLKSENFKRIRSIEITPEGSVITIGGENGEGKSSLLKAIAAALFGTAAVPKKEPVRRGAEFAETTLELTNGITIKQKIKQDRTVSLSITKDGLKGNQSTLNEILSPYTIDPLKFAHLKSSERRDTLLKLAELDFSEADKKFKEAYDQRTGVGRDYDRCKARLDSLVEYPDAPGEEVTVAALTNELTFAHDLRNQADTLQRQAESERGRAEEHEANVVRLGEEIERMKEEIIRLEGLQERSRRQIEASADKAMTLEGERQAIEVPDIDAIQTQLLTAETVNRQVRANRERKVVADELSHWEIERDRITRTMEAINAEKQKRLQTAEFPLPGLTVTDDDVIYNSFVYDEASESDRFRVSIAIGLALGKGISVLLCESTPYMDADSMATLRQVADEMGAQLFLEIGGTGEGMTYVIEDGELVE